MRKQKDIKLSRETLYNLQTVEPADLKQWGGGGTISACSSGAVRCFNTACATC